ncbi:MAG: GIY-YIG nuclease family protein [Burkholderiaceae bacterium]
MQPFWVYILRCADGSYYTGHTDNLALRMQQHHDGLADSYTATRKPVELVFQEACETRVQALTLERQIKGWNRAKKEALISGDFSKLVQLAKSQSPSTGSGRTVPRSISLEKR